MRRWNIKNIATVIAILIILYTIFSNGYHKYTTNIIIPNTKPEAVWNYVADFNNIKALNPSILDFKILSESGHRHDWRYTVQYTECSLYGPISCNSVIGNYVVKTTMPNEQQHNYTVVSMHETCFFMGLYCSKVENELNFFAEGDDTHVYGQFLYECFPLLHNVCKRTTVRKRQAFLQNLQELFYKERHKTSEKN